MTPTVALPDLDTANKLRHGNPCHQPGRNALCPACGQPARLIMNPVWPGLPVDEEQWHRLKTKTEPGDFPAFRPVRAGDRVTFTVPCDEPMCRGGEVQYPEWEGRTETCQRCDGAGRVPVFSAVIDPATVVVPGEYPPSLPYVRRYTWQGGSVLYTDTDYVNLPDDLPITDTTTHVLMIDADTIEDA